MDLILPIVHVEADNLPEAWEKAVIETWEQGAQIATQYDQPGDPPSRDATAIIAVKDPFAEPRIHRGLPGGIDQLEVYRQEVMDGIHDHWIGGSEKAWPYSYHERLFAYKLPDGRVINQIQQMINALVKAPFTRRANAITWMPWLDPDLTDPPCLQSLWCRIFSGDQGEELVMDIRIRSNDAFKAAFMNMYAFTDLQRVIAEKVSERLSRKIKVGQYTHIADSFHIYGSYFEEFRSFLELINTRSFEKRTYRAEEVADLIEEARLNIAHSLEEERRTGRKGL